MKLNQLTPQVLESFNYSKPNANKYINREIFCLQFYDPLYRQLTAFFVLMIRLFLLSPTTPPPPTGWKLWQLGHELTFVVNYRNVCRSKVVNIWAKNGTKFRLVWLATSLPSPVLPHYCIIHRRTDCFDYLMMLLITQKTVVHIFYLLQNSNSFVELLGICPQ